MATAYRNVGSLESSASLASLAAGGPGAYMDYDSAGGNARFGAKGGATANLGVQIRTLVAGVALTVLAFASSGAATFARAVTITTGGLTITAGALAAQTITAAGAIQVTGGSAVPGAVLKLPGSYGMTIVGAAGVDYNFAVLTPANDPVFGVLTGTTTVSFTGPVQIAGGNGSAVPGSLTKTNSFGLTLAGVSGSTYDYAVVTPGLFTVFGVITGTRNAEFLGSVRVANGLTVSANGISVLAGASAFQSATFASNIGFFGHAAASKPTVTGSRASGAALVSALAALSSLGLWTDSTTA